VQQAVERVSSRTNREAIERYVCTPIV